MTSGGTDKIGERIRIKWLIGANANGGGGKNAGYWYLRPVEVDGKDGWRLTYQIRDQDVASVQPIDGYDPAQAVMILMGNMQETIIECFRDNQREVHRWEQVPDAPPSFWPEGYRRVRGVKNFPRWQEGKMKKKGQAILRNMIKDIERVAKAIAAKGWPEPVIEPWPWGDEINESIWRMKV